MFIEAVILGLLAGKLRGGSFGNMRNVKLKHLWLLILSLLIEILTPMAADRGFSIISGYILYTQIMQYGLLFIFIIINLKYKSLLLTGAGSLMNLIVITANNGHMPVGSLILKAAAGSSTVRQLLRGGIVTYQLADKNTHFAIMGDIIPVNFLYNRMISLGDIIISLGLFFLLQEFMLEQGYKKTAYINIDRVDF